MHRCAFIIITQVHGFLMDAYKYRMRARPTCIRIHVLYHLKMRNPKLMTFTLHTILHFYNSACTWIKYMGVRVRLLFPIVDI
jgi:hypothetical protein